MFCSLHLCLSYVVQLTLSYRWFRQWKCAEQPPSPRYLNQWLSMSLAHICVTIGRPQGVNGMLVCFSYSVFQQVYSHYLLFCKIVVAGYWLSLFIDFSQDENGKLFPASRFIVLLHDIRVVPVLQHGGILLNDISESPEMVNVTKTRSKQIKTVCVCRVF